MKVDWEYAHSFCKKLEKKGFVHKNFFFQTGGGEDENDMEIYVKDDIAVTFDCYSNSFKTCKYSNMNYVDGWDYNNETIF